MSTSPLVNRLVLVAATACLVANIGCATVVAMGIPGPVPDEAVTLGMHRSEVETFLRYAQRSEFPEAPAGTTVRYEYKDGPHQGSKGRVVLYIAGDIFTVFLSELIFWPIELYASGRTDRVATAYFDEGNRLGMWTISRPAGKGVLVTMGERPAPVAASAPKPAGGDGTPPVSSGPVTPLPNPVDSAPKTSGVDP